MANFIQLEIDKKDIEKAIKHTTLRIDSILVKMQKRVNQFVIKSSKARFRSLFNVSNHNLYTINSPLAENNQGKNAKEILKNYRNVKSKREKGVTWVLQSSFWANWLENGAHIEAKNGKWLTFKVNGEWKKVQSVTIPARPFIKPAVDEYYGSGKSVKIMEEVLEKELARYWSSDKTKYKF